jgi:hypothetical protein
LGFRQATQRALFDQIKLQFLDKLQKVLEIFQQQYSATVENIERKDFADVGRDVEKHFCKRYKRKHTRARSIFGRWIFTRSKNRFARKIRQRLKVARPYAHSCC